MSRWVGNQPNQTIELMHGAGAAVGSLNPTFAETLAVVRPLMNPGASIMTDSSLLNVPIRHVIIQSDHTENPPLP